MSQSASTARQRPDMQPRRIVQGKLQNSMLNVLCIWVRMSEPSTCRSSHSQLQQTTSESTHEVAAQREHSQSRRSGLFSRRLPEPKVERRRKEAVHADAVAHVARRESDVSF